MSNSTKRLRIEEDEPITKPFNWSQFVRLLRYIKPYRRYFIYSLLLMMLATFYNLAGPYLIRLVIDIDIPQRNIHALLYKAVFYIVLTLLYVISLRVRTIFMTKLGNSVVSDIRMHLFIHLQKLSLNFFDSRPAGKIMVRVMNDVDSLSELLSNSILNVLVDTLSLWAIIVIMLSIDIKLSIVALGVLPLLISIIMILKNSIRTRWQDVRKKSSTLNAYIHESILGIMLQDTFIFSGTIADNIRYAKPDATMDEVIRAAKIVNAHEFIMKMENGYDTEVNERGSRLSIGQRQLIAFARALLADPKILILDEATSAVDTQTEVLIQQAIEKLTSGRTSIIIAHRLSTIRNADRIFVIHDGQIVEEGSHTQLLEKKGYYYNLYTSQFKYFEK